MNRGQGTVTDDSANAAENDAATLVQLSLFDAVQPIPMNINPNNIDAIEPVENDAVEADAVEAYAVVTPRLESNQIPEGSSTVGLRLRQARTAHGLSVEDVAHRLKLPHTVIEALEGERFDRIGHGIFLRGYLAKYLHLLDLPQTLADSVLDQQDELPPLMTSGMVSRPRYLFDRYSGSALYLILTGVIIVPAVLLAMHVGFEGRVARIAPLDAPVFGAQVANTQSDIATHAVTIPEGVAAAVDSKVIPDNSNLPAVMASMATFSAPAAEPVVAAPAPVNVPAATGPDDGSHSLHLHLVEPSWVEVVDGAGKQLEYALLPAGTARDYHSKQSLSVLLGNAAGASIRVDGKPRDLAPYLRGNVARFKLADGGWTASPSGG